jgi:uncharacterized protein YegP (UPF0339 family)
MATKGYAERADCLKTLDMVKTTLDNAKPADSKD